MKTVILMGAAYKFSKRSWKKFLEKWQATGAMPEIDRFATMVCVHTPNITDWDHSDVEDALSSLDDEKRSEVTKIQHN
jgi:hypothetical protein